MKKQASAIPQLWGILFVSLWLVTSSLWAQIPDAPNPPRLVTDLAGILSPEEVQALEQKLLGYEDSTSTQVAIVTVKTLDGYDVSQYAVELALKWKIGQKGKDNGILIVVAPSERKMTIQTGYGIEGALPDITANQIIQTDMRPAFKQNRYYDGLDAATTSIIRVLSGEYKGVPKQNEKDGPAGFIILIVLLLVVFSIISRRRGGGGTTISGGRGGFFPPILFLPTGGGSSWGGGSSGGGSFGGFGGGGFGGGGASGDW